MTDWQWSFEERSSKRRDSCRDAGAAGSPERHSQVPTGFTKPSRPRVGATVCSIGCGRDGAPADSQQQLARALLRQQPRSPLVEPQPGEPRASPANARHPTSAANATSRSRRCLREGISMIQGRTSPLSTDNFNAKARPSNPKVVGTEIFLCLDIDSKRVSPPIMHLFADDCGEHPRDNPQRPNNRQKMTWVRCRWMNWAHRDADSGRRQRCARTVAKGAGNGSTMEPNLSRCHSHCDDGLRRFESPGPLGQSRSNG